MTESPVNTTIEGPDVSAIISAETIIQSFVFKYLIHFIQRKYLILWVKNVLKFHYALYISFFKQKALAL